MTAIITQHVEKSNPDKDRLEEYTVTQWLADVEGHITLQKITDDAAKIKEALILVNTDHENAHGMLTIADFAELKTFTAFKMEYLSFWRSTGNEDKLLNICNFIFTPREGEEFLNLYN